MKTLASFLAPFRATALGVLLVGMAAVTAAQTRGEYVIAGSEEVVKSVQGREVTGRVEVRTTESNEVVVMVHPQNQESALVYVLDRDVLEGKTVSMDFAQAQVLFVKHGLVVNGLDRKYVLYLGTRKPKEVLPTQLDVNISTSQLGSKIQEFVLRQAITPDMLKQHESVYDLLPK